MLAIVYYQYLRMAELYCHKQKVVIIVLLILLNKCIMNIFYLQG